MTQIQLTSSDILQLAFYTLIGISVLLVSSTVITAIAFWRTTENSTRTFTRFYEQGAALRLITVGMIIIGSCFLALIGKIGSDAVVAILSGIVGYVLGGSGRAKNKVDESKL